MISTKLNEIGKLPHPVSVSLSLALHPRYASIVSSLYTFAHYFMRISFSANTHASQQCNSFPNRRSFHTYCVVTFLLWTVLEFKSVQGHKMSEIKHLLKVVCLIFNGINGTCIHASPIAQQAYCYKRRKEITIQWNWTGHISLGACWCVLCDANGSG